jgi:4-amino-4-deoxy-L-arabinose transferase-like glycosyltransferase
MCKRSAAWLESDFALLLLVALARVALHTLSNGQYGFHRDELQTLDDARHLDWGFVAYPPITPLIGRLELVLFGTSLVGFRVFAAVAVSTVMVLTGLMARELGAKRHLQLLAALAAGISPVSLVQGAVLQYVSFDYLWGVAVFYLLVRLLKSDDPRWWVPIGGFLGLGMETRYTMGFLALALAVAVALTGARRFLRSGWLWAGVGLAIVVFLPNVMWQARHDFVSLDFLAHIHARDLRQGRYNGFLIEQLWVSMNLVTAPLAALGLWFSLVVAEGRRYRLVGWTVVVTLAMYVAVGARSYYTAPLYPALLAAGAVRLGAWLGTLRPALSRSIYGVQWALVTLSGVLFIAVLTPVAQIGSRLWNLTSKMHDQFREEIGWQELAENVQRVYQSLPTEERARAGILAGNYGEGGALNLYGPGFGLPHAMSLTNSFWYRGYDSRQPETVILVGFDPSEARRLFESCTIAAKNRNRYGVSNEESKDHPDILLCRKLNEPWPEYWSKSRRFG